LISIIDIFHLAWCKPDVFSNFAWKIWLSHTIIGTHALSQSCIIDLLILRWVLSAFRIDIVCQHIVSIDITTDSGISVSLSIEMKSRFPEVSDKSRVRQPSSSRVQFINSFIHVLFLLLLCWQTSLFLIFLLLGFLVLFFGL
jgi:hypothetical protein